MLWPAAVTQADPPQNTEKIGAVNTAYTVGAIVAGWFGGGPLADYAGRRVGMAAGAIMVIIATCERALERSEE